jgi:hypothetical protein
MIAFRNALLICLISSVIACKKPVQPVPVYAISKVIKTDTLTTVNVHIATRMPVQQLLLIAGKLKADSTKIQNLAIHYLLPGNSDFTAGENSYYALAKYIKESDVKPTDTLKDLNDNVFRIRIFGLSQQKAMTLLSVQPHELFGKNIVGRFIDDYNHTVIIPFYDPLDKKNELYIVEVDSAAKIVSRTIPLKVTDGIERWQVTPNGDYITLKDSVLSQFAVDGLGVPFNSIKAGK